MGGIFRSAPRGKFINTALLCCYRFERGIARVFFPIISVVTLLRWMTGERITRLVNDRFQKKIGLNVRLP